VRVLYLSLVIILGDQISKLLVKGLNLPALGISWQGMPYGTSKEVLGSFFRLTYIENPGMAFGIDIGGRLYFSLFQILASVAILVYLYRLRTGSLGIRIALALVFAGAVGNLIDRVFYGFLFHEGPLFYGRVVDFIDLDFFDISVFGYSITRFFVFNIADASVTIGVILLLLFHRPPPEPVSASPVPAPTPDPLPPIDPASRSPS
jgi:signal peptidase II